MTADLCRKIYQQTEAELCQHFPGLYVAAASLPFVFEREKHTYGTDGLHFYASSNLIPLFLDAQHSFLHGLLHTLIHCMYLHLNPPANVNRQLWNLTCDIWTEQMISTLKLPGFAIHEPLLKEFPVFPDAAVLYRHLSEKLSNPEKRFNPEENNNAFSALIPAQGRSDTPSLSEPMKKLQISVTFDDHSFWQPMTEGQKEIWSEIRSGGGEVGKGLRGSQKGSLEEEVEIVKSSLSKYQSYLRQFCVYREEPELDTESFDYIYYHLGMEHASIPLMEPLEYKEVWRLDTLAIAIDTSLSCSREVVSTFLTEIYSILSRQENFFKKMKVVLFQCDCYLQDTTIIDSREQWFSYIDHLTIKGRGGTDYCPVYREIEKLRKEGTIKKPRALLYFTDGDGLYPDKPDYETIFILAGKKKHPEMVPSWASKLLLDE